MAMGGYSFGNGMMDPLLMQQITDYVPESPYAAMSRQDPSFGPAAAEYIGNLASPSMPSPDTAMGVGQPLLSDHSDGPDVMQVIGGIVSAPFRALGVVKEGLEDALGHRNSRMRSAEDLQIEIATKLGWVNDAIKPHQKAVLWPERFAQERAAYDARSYSEGDSAHGRNTNGLPLPEARKTGVWEWLTGETQRQRQRDLARAQMAQRVVEDNIKAEELRTEQALGDLRRTQTEGAQWDVTQGYKYGDLEKQWGLREQQANVGAREASAESSRANAAQSYASIGNMGADNARADAEQKRREVAALLDDKLRRQQIREKQLDVRGKRLDLERQEEQGPYGDDTGYDKLGRAFKLSQFITKYNSAGDERERKAVIGTYQVPTRMEGGYETPFGTFGEKEEPDFDAVRFRPQRPDPAVGPAVPGQGDPQRVHDISLVLRRFMSGDEGTIMARAKEIAPIEPSLDRSSERAFARSARAAGLSQQEGQALWQGLGR